MAGKSDGTQFLLSIKPKYRTTVTPILQKLKENREASDFVCQAILEKFSRDGGITSIELEVQNLLQGKGFPFATPAVSQESNSSQEQTQVQMPRDITVRVNEQVLDHVLEPATPLHGKGNINVEPSLSDSSSQPDDQATPSDEELIEDRPVTEQQEVTVSTEKMASSLTSSSQKDSLANRFFNEDE